MKCKNCHREFGDILDKCPHCGAEAEKPKREPPPIDEGIKEEVITPNEEISGSVSAEPAALTDEQMRAYKKKISIYEGWNGAGYLICCFLLLFGAYIGFGDIHYTWEVFQDNLGRRIVDIVYAFLCVGMAVVHIRVIPKLTFVWANSFEYFKFSIWTRIVRIVLIISYYLLHGGWGSNANVSLFIRIYLILTAMENVIEIVFILVQQRKIKKNLSINDEN